MIITANGWKLEPKEQRIALAVMVLAFLCFIGYTANNGWWKLDQFGHTKPAANHKRLQ